MRRPVPARPVRAPRAAVAATLCLGLLTACSGEVSTGAEGVEASELEEHVRSSYQPGDGVELTVECPEDLAAEVDATADCTADDGESETGVRFTATEVEGDEVAFESVPFLSPEELVRTLTATLEGEGYDVEALDCPEELPGVADATAQCAVTSQGEEGVLAVTVEEVDGLRFRLGWEAGA